MKPSVPISRLLNSAPLQRCQSTAARHRRGGLTLVEMLLATIILVTALAALAQQNSLGTRAALRSQRETEAALRCQSQLNRLLFEERLSANMPERAFDDDPEWRWSATKTPAKFEGLSLLTVRVFRSGRYKQISSYSLSRLSPTASAVSDSGRAGRRP